MTPKPIHPRQIEVDGLLLRPAHDVIRCPTAEELVAIARSRTLHAALSEKPWDEGRC